MIKLAIVLIPGNDALFVFLVPNMIPVLRNPLDVPHGVQFARLMMIKLAIPGITSNDAAQRISPNGKSLAIVQSELLRARKRVDLGGELDVV